MMVNEELAVDRCVRLSIFVRWRIRIAALRRKLHKPGTKSPSYIWPIMGLTFSARADPSNDLMGLAFRTSFEMVVKFFQDFVIAVNLVQTALDGLGVYVRNEKN